MNIGKALETATVEESLFVWMTVHGNLCLALRHPGNAGASRAYTEAFVDKLGTLLVQRQLLSKQELDRAHRIERAFTPRMRVYDPLAADHPLVKTDEHRCAKCHEPFEPGAHVTLIPVDPGGQGGTVAALPAHAQCIEELTETSLEKDS